MEMQDPIGALWLIQEYDIPLFLPLIVKSGIASRRVTEKISETGFRIELYQEKARPEATLISHLQFHLKHEIINLEFLARFFKKVGCKEIQQWINDEPTGQYARRAAFLYEWLTEEKLQVPENIGGNYVDVLNDQWVVTASPNQVEKNSRWRVNNNLAGTADFCPILLKNDAFLQSVELNISVLLNELIAEFGEDLLMRSSVWLTLRESKASFTIEGEGNQTDRIARFADVIARNTGKGDLPLTQEALARLQQEILGNQTVINHYGIRQSPVFVGQTYRFKEIVHYIAPPYEYLPQKLRGILQFWQKTIGQSAIMRSAVVSFGFVYLHPLADGNGRVHRFLFNDTLKRDGVLPDNVILPISGVIAESAAERLHYANMLDEISKPLMENLYGLYSFSKEHYTYADGIKSNLCFNENQLAEPLWRYPDLTKHVIYLAGLIQKVIESDMREESKYLQQHEQAREAVKNIVDMPNHYIDRIIRSILQNNGVVGNKLVKEFPFLADKTVEDKLVKQIASIFQT
ncbi:Fic family protein [Actinobacillus genomosp. 1]|uniref:Fic family protein n=1 Tax=Actinobacillus genomosp. 1 TaxID=254839 RepID=UPI002441029F|nr:Fic family protein [Actinobacillus genomosp. 1]WGE91145.1 Fic family protein [Actinobacillus genomosp. 1]